ncbi:MAG: AraD1 family protein [Mesorhizobium sp.]
MRLVQFIENDGSRQVGAVGEDDETKLRVVIGVSSVRDLALEAHRSGTSLREAVERRGLGDAVDYDAIIAEKRILPPLDHPEPARTIVAITGLTHLGSAKSRDEMHAKLASDDLSDSMKMFKLGVEGGKPRAGNIGVQPEWAYKGDGSWVVAPEQPIELPGYAEDGGEEAEIAGLYVIGDEGEVLRVGFALGNEYSDHVMERRNYLYLAHSKLRQCSFGPELLVGDLPHEVSGISRVLRDNREIWRGEFLSGEANMCHSIANLEHHHFKYAEFRRPGDVHVYFYGASALSCADGVKTAPGDVFEVSSDLFGKPLRNELVAGQGESVVHVKAL